jgi:hypothetical protein
MAIKPLPPRELVHQLLDYDPVTGVFRWRKRAKTGTTADGWNAKFAGEIAGRIDTNGYISISILNTRYRAHRLAWLYVYGEPVPNLIDHEDTNRQHNWIRNLRVATKVENAEYSRLYSANKSGVKGVLCLHGRFRAKITHNGVVHYLGMFSTLEEAAAARREAAERLHGSFRKDW